MRSSCTCVRVLCWVAGLIWGQMFLSIPVLLGMDRQATYGGSDHFSAACVPDREWLCVTVCARVCVCAICLSGKKALCKLVLLFIIEFYYKCEKTVWRLALIHYVKNLLDCKTVKNELIRVSGLIQWYMTYIKMTRTLEAQIRICICSQWIFCIFLDTVASTNRETKARDVHCTWANIWKRYWIISVGPAWLH